MLARYIAMTVVISISLGTVDLAIGQEPRGYAYDPTTGTEFRWRTDQDGNRHIVETNRQSKTIANTTIKSDGSQKGIDGDGTYWTYDRVTGVYANDRKQLFCVVKPLNARCIGGE